MSCGDPARARPVPAAGAPALQRNPELLVGPDGRLLRCRGGRRAVRESRLLVVFGATLCLSATLLFAIQPMFAKMVLPLLGGSPQVWNICMVFYQAALLVGYGYAHLAISLLGPRRQALLHLPLLGLPLLFLPIGLAPGWDPTRSESPTAWLLGLLGTSVGVPFLVTAANAPMLQRWFSATGHPAAGDPYFLYGSTSPPPTGREGSTSRPPSPGAGRGR